MAAALALAAGACVLLGVSGVSEGVVAARGARSFAFPAALAKGVVGDLVPPVGTTPRFSFQVGKVAVGELPIPMPLRLGRRGRGRETQRFVRLVEAGPHARLLLTGVVDTDGHLVSSSGNQLVIEAAVSPSNAAVNPPPYVIPFDIDNGAAYVDAPLAVARQGGIAINVQILGVSIADSTGEVFGVLGFALRPLLSTAAPQTTPTLPPRPPHSHICCQCKDPAKACFDLSLVEAQATCPPHCESFPSHECDGSGSCVPLKSCASDRDCDDGNSCTIDRCTPEGCAHDCVCVGPLGCRPGPGAGPRHP